MNRVAETNKIDVVMLCGGEGRRLRQVVNDRPKSMAAINGRPFLDMLIDYAVNFGFRRFILCTGYMGDFIKRYYQDRKGPAEIIFSQEKQSLGTAGAIKNAESFIKSSLFLAMNGDSFCPIDLKEFIKFHFDKGALCSMVLTRTSESDDCGEVTLGKSQHIIMFDEKIRNHKESFVNVGVYLFQEEILQLMPANKNLSLERDFFPEMVDKQFYGYITQEKFIDIGTPARYEMVQKMWSR